MRVTYDAESDCSYFYFTDSLARGEARSIPLNVEGMPGMLVLDVDRDGKLLGLEVVGASGLLRGDALEKLAPAVIAES